jgi:hypothetical protein
MYSVGVFFDLKKAFDVCSHDTLLMKLSRMGISGTALNWFKSYLADRSQKIPGQKIMSEMQIVNSGMQMIFFSLSQGLKLLNNLLCTHYLLPGIILLRRLNYNKTESPLNGL